MHTFHVAGKYMVKYRHFWKQQFSSAVLTASYTYFLHHNHASINVSSTRFRNVGLCLIQMWVQGLVLFSMFNDAKMSWENQKRCFSKRGVQIYGAEFLNLAVDVTVVTLNVSKCTCLQTWLSASFRNINDDRANARSCKYTTKLH